MKTDDGNKLRTTKLRIEDDGTYRYFGGHDDQGNLHAGKNDGRVEFRIDVVGNRWKVHDVEFEGNPGDQLSWRPDGDSAVIIHNANTGGMDVKYSVVVRDARGQVVRCDPMIHNEPRG